MKQIPDAACGSKMFWYDRDNENVLFVDNRSVTDTLCDGRKLIIKPDVVADFTKLPFEDGTFRLVVFDPPHLLRIGETSWMAKKYGKLPKHVSDYQKQ